MEPQHEVPNQVDGHHTGNCLFQRQAHTQPEFKVGEADPDSRACHQVTLHVTREAARLRQGLQVLADVLGHIAARLGLISPVVTAKEDDWIHGLFYLAWTAGTVTTRSGSSERTSCTRRLP